MNSEREDIKNCVVEVLVKVLAELFMYYLSK